MNLRTLEIASGIRAEVLKILLSIEAAESIQAINMTSHRAEGFVLGLETASALKKEIIEMLYIGFEAATQDRRAHLQKW